jgi:phosphoribosylformimino-5-aminoimidazole carboxamide ribotide isomerase
VTLKVVPSIDLKDGKSVKLVRGVPGTGIEVSNEPVELAAYWEREGAEILHLVDLDRALEGRETNKEIIKQIVQAVSIPVEVGGGIRSEEDVAELLNLGARWVIVGTKAVENPEFLTDLLESTSSANLIIALDAKGGRIVTRGWTVKTQLGLEEAVRSFDRFRPAAYLCTNVAIEGTMTGIDFEEMKRVVDCTETSIIYSGGVSSLKDLKALRAVGIYAAVVGMALYKGAFTLREAQGVVSNA